MSIRVIVTRPAREAARWVEALREHGLDAQACALIDIVPVSRDDELQRLEQARAHVKDLDACMFVSANAVEAFLDGFRWPPGPRCWATGPGTVAALLAAGVERSRIDAPGADSAQFDSEALWKIVGSGDWSARRVLIVRGAGKNGDDARGKGRDWLAAQLTAAGASVDFVVAYRRLPPQIDDERVGVLNAWSAAGAIWLFSSSEAVENMPADVHAHGVRALATHERIAQAARSRGFEVKVCRPDLSEVVRSIESFHV